MSRIRRLVGAGVVIDGTIWKKADGTDEVLSILVNTDTSCADNGTFNTSTKKLTYNVKNDCLLSIIASGLALGSTAPSSSCAIAVNGVLVDSLNENNDTASSEWATCSKSIPVSRGSVVTVYNWKDDVIFSGFNEARSSGITFTEFKLV